MTARQSEIPVCGGCGKVLLAEGRCLKRGEWVSIGIIDPSRGSCTDCAPADPSGDAETWSPADIASAEAAYADMKTMLADTDALWKRAGDRARRAEEERDSALARCETWKRNIEHQYRRAAAAEKARDDAVLAERARINGWWEAWRMTPMTHAERDVGIASGAPAPGGGK